MRDAAMLCRVQADPGKTGAVEPPVLVVDEVAATVETPALLVIDERIIGGVLDAADRLREQCGCQSFTR